MNPIKTVQELYLWPSCTCLLKANLMRQISGVYTACLSWTLPTWGIFSETTSLLIASLSFSFLFLRWYVLRTLKQPRHVFKFPSKHSIEQSSFLQLLQTLRCSIWLGDTHCSRPSAPMLSPSSPRTVNKSESTSPASSCSMAQYFSHVGQLIGKFWSTPKRHRQNTRAQSKHTRTPHALSTTDRSPRHRKLRFLFFKLHQSSFLNLKQIAVFNRVPYTSA